MKTVVITGGTGLIGTAFSKLLTEQGYQVIILTRHPKPATGNVSYASWNPDNKTIDRAAIEQADYIINLAGAGVADKRWSKKRKQEIVISRVNSGVLLIKALQDIPNKVQAVISVSGIGWYGDDNKREAGKPFFIEGDPAADDFLGTTCVQWEESVEPVKQLGRRLVIFRVGVVLSDKGGALPEFKRPVRFGIAAFLGNGKQQLSWIHIDDVCRMFLFALENERIDGIYNATAPHPVSNKELTTTLAKKMKGNFYIPVYVPSFVLKIVLGELSIEVLKSATVSSEKIGKAGFQFLYPTISSAFS
jgi:uncharacterized protein